MQIAKYVVVTYWHSVGVFSSDFFSFRLPFFEWVFFFVLEFHFHKNLTRALLETNEVIVPVACCYCSIMTQKHKTIDVAQTPLCK